MFVAPDHPLIQYTDSFAVDVTSARARFSRPALDKFGFEHVSPGARVRFTTDAREVQVRLLYSALMIREDAFASGGAVLVDGKINRTFRHKGAWNSLSVQEMTITYTAPTARVHDIVMPYGASLDFQGLTLSGGDLRPTPARPPLRFVAYGDSVTQGFQGGDVTRSWAFMLAEAKSWQLINLGYGSRQMTPGDAAIIAAAKPDVVAVQVGFNDYARQTPLGPFLIGFHAFLTQLCALCPTATIYVLSPLWTASENTVVSIKVYWAAINDATRAVNCDRVRLVDGRALTDHELACFVDGIHPNDTGMRQITDRLLPQIA